MSFFLVVLPSIVDVKGYVRSMEIQAFACILRFYCDAKFEETTLTTFLRKVEVQFGGRV